MHLSGDAVEIIIRFLRERLNPYLIMLFGSAARGEMRAGSDVDIAFLSDRVCNEKELFFIAQELAARLDRDVHLINLDTVSTVMQAQVVNKGEIIYEQDKLRRQEFFILVLKKYARLNEERAPILERINERGSIYVDDVILNKLEIIERCIRRIHVEYDGDPENLENITRQDSIILNLQRACEAAIAIAMHIVAKQGWGIPGTSRDAFETMLAKNS